LFVQKEKGAVPTTVREGFCISCGHCAAICPEGAIAHMDFPSERIRPIQRAHLPSSRQVIELLRARRSVRVFTDEPVKKDDLEAVIEAARLAPTAHNVQTTAFTVVQSRELLKQIVQLTADFLARTGQQLRNPMARALLHVFSGRELKGALMVLPEFDLIVQAVREGLDPILRGAPCLLVFHAPSETVLPDTNAQLAAQNATLMAQSLGLGSFYTGYVLGASKRDKRIPQLLSIPRGHHVYAGLALGHPRFEFANWPDRKPAMVNWL
jgi:nitroreductase